MGTASLDHDEAAAIAAARGLAERERVVAFNRLARGWSVGLVLLVQAAQAGVPIALETERPPQAVLDYLGVALFAQFPREDQDALVRCALAPRLTPSLACALGGARAGAMLRELQRQRLFVDRIAGEGDEPAYELHPLFREFLLVRAQASVPARELTELRATAARHFEDCEQIEAAVRLHAEAGAWSEIARLVSAHASGLLATGRMQTVAAWISEVPAAERLLRPWLLHWLGVARVLPDAAEGRALLGAAFEVFDRAGDPLGALLSCAEVLHSFVLDWRSVVQVGDWIARYESLLGPDPSLRLELFSLPLAVRILGAAQAIIVADAKRGSLLGLVGLCEVCARRAVDAETRAHALLAPMLYWCWAGEFARSLDLAQDVLRREAELGTPSLVLVSFIAAMTLWQMSREEEALGTIERARRRACELGVDTFDFMLDSQQIYCLTSLNRLDEAQRLLQQRAPQVPAGFENEWQSIRAGLQLMRGEVTVACATLEAIISREPPGTFGAATGCVQYGTALACTGDHTHARPLLAEAIEFAAAMPSPITEFHARVALAYSFLVAGDDIAAGFDHLRRALAVGAARDYLNCHPWRLAHVLSFVFSRALEENIEPEYVRRFIRRRNLRPDSPDVPGWPWPLRVYGLGHLRVLRDDGPLPSGRKAQRRVLQLLGAIVALGPRSATRQALIDALWPELEGDAGVDAFEATVYRLRKLLGSDAAVRLEHTVVTLDPGLVWIDAEAFERLADEVERGSGHAPLAPPLQRALDKALTLYAGPLLDGEEERPWVLAARQRLGSRLVRLAQTVSEAHTRKGAHAAAVDVLARAIELEPFAEDLHRRLIEALADAGRRAEAVAAYRRCEDLLGRTLGVRPSPETKRAIDRLRRGAGVD